MRTVYIVLPESLHDGSKHRVAGRESRSNRTSVRASRYQLDESMRHTLLQVQFRPVFRAMLAPFMPNFKRCGATRGVQISRRAPLPSTRCPHEALRRSQTHEFRSKTHYDSLYTENYKRNRNQSRSQKSPPRGRRSPLTECNRARIINETIRRINDLRTCRRRPFFGLYVIFGGFCSRVFG